MHSRRAPCCTTVQFREYSVKSTTEHSCVHWPGCLTVFAGLQFLQSDVRWPVANDHKSLTQPSDRITGLTRLTRLSNKAVRMTDFILLQTGIQTRLSDCQTYKTVRLEE